MSFEERLNQLIIDSAMSHKEIAAKTRISAGNISHYRNGKVKPSFDAIIDLANLFQVSTDYLLLGNEGVSFGGKRAEDPQLQTWINLFYAVPEDARALLIVTVTKDIEYARQLQAQKKFLNSAGTSDCAAAKTPGNSNIA